MEVSRAANHLPAPARALDRVVSPLNRLFDWLYHSNYNPLYRSGTLAVGLLLTLFVTGLYLSFFYSVSDPYASMQRIQNQIWLGRWIRALHRYASDAALIAVIFHILQLLVQGKTWGPRTLAWISGIFLLGMLWLAASTGYVMVWDTHGQVLAMAGAEMLSVFPFLSDVLAQAFNGLSPVTAGFFFMNLFLHVALPLMLLIGLWVHTAKLSRSVWLPIRQILLGTIAAFVILSLLWPAVLGPPADLLRVPSNTPIDILYGAWILVLQKFSVWPTFIIFAAIAGALFSIPWWWRPSRSQKRPESTVDLALCTGCMQCSRDCPYEAILMLPRDDGKRLIAKVLPSNCVSCGICAASCDDLAIGPEGRTAMNQVERVAEFVKVDLASASSDDVVVIACTNNQILSDRLIAFASAEKGLHVYRVECCGCLHSNVIESLVGRCGGVFIIGCPARNCYNRDGFDLLAGRIFEKRVPFVARSVDRRRISINANSEAEADECLEQLEEFRARVKVLSSGGDGLKKTKTYPVAQRVRTVLATTVILASIAAVSQIESGQSVKGAVVRVSGRIPGYIKRNCRKPSAEEVAKIPVHMRKPQICDEQFLNYDVSVSIDGIQVLQSKLENGRQLTDRPLFLNEDVQVPAGEHLISVNIIPREESLKQDLGLTCESKQLVGVGQIVLVRYDANTNQLVCGNSI